MSKLEILQKNLELKYEGHDFNWRESGNRRILGLCPEHPDKNPSFNIFLHNDKAYYKCFSCGFHGGSGKPLSETEIERIKISQENQAIAGTVRKLLIENLNKSGQDGAAFKYLTEKRGLKPAASETLEPLRTALGEIGWTGNIKLPILQDEGNKTVKENLYNLEKYRDGLTFFHTALDGGLSTIRVRTGDITGSERVFKTVKISDTPAGFNLFNAVQFAEKTRKKGLNPHIFIVEGEFDILTFIAKTGQSNICSCSASSLFLLAKSLKNNGYLPVVCPDNDEGGYSAVRAALKGSDDFQVLSWADSGFDNFKDFDEIFKSLNYEQAISRLNSFKFEKLSDIRRREKEREKEEIQAGITGLPDNIKELYLNGDNKKTLFSAPKIDILKAFTEIPPKLDFVLPGLLHSCVGGLIAQGDSGKSYLAMQLAISITVGRDILKLPAGYEFNLKNPAKVLYLAAEDPAAPLIFRLNAIGKHLSESERNLAAKNLDFRELRGIKKNLLDQSIQTELAKMAVGTRLVILDTFRRFNDEDENDSRIINNILNVLEEIAIAKNVSFLYLHHTSKFANSHGLSSEAQAGRGSAALSDNARGMLNLSSLDKDDIVCIEKGIGAINKAKYIKLSISKHNYSSGANFVLLERGNTGVLQTSDIQLTAE